MNSPQDHPLPTAPSLPPPGDLPAGLSVAGLAALLRQDQRLRWRRGERPRIEDYLAGYPALRADADAVLDLVYAEFVLREDLGEAPAAAEYLSRFPQYADALRRQLELHRGLLAGSTPPLSEVATMAPVPAAEGPTLPPAAASDVETMPPPRAAGAPQTRAPGAGETVVIPGFEILGVLGEGGMGVVYKARQQGLGRLVALKTIRAHYASDPQAEARFRREAAAVARLDHPHIVKVHSWGEREGMLYFALEFCTGGSLHGKLHGQPQPPEEAARLVEKLARAVQAAHDQGIVHRDLKPANVLLAPPGDEPALNTLWGIPKVADFGLCRTFETDVQRTAEGSVAGSPPYMAPEQAEGRMKDIGPATDVWALGVILYELLTGRQPFPGSNLIAILSAVCTDEPPRPGELHSGVPEELEAICLKCLRKPAGERYARAADLAEALRGWLLEAGHTGKGLPVVSRRRPAAGRRRKVWATAGVFVAALLGLGAWVWLGRTPSAAPVPPPDPNAEVMAPAQPQPQTKPLKIALQVLRLTQGEFNFAVNELGATAFYARFNQKVEPKAVFSEPAYGYLLAFNPAEKSTDLEQFLPRSGATVPPVQGAELNPKIRFTLNDGQGLQAFAVVASRRPLPPYAEWRKRQPPCPWQRTPAKVGVVMRSDGNRTEEFFSEGVTRGGEEASDRKVFEDLAAWLKGLEGVEAVAVLGFAVDRSE